MNNLNKENFFNKQMELTPLAMKHFCDWIDDYKKEVWWYKLFKNSLNPDTKFHDIPFEMQIGIIIKWIFSITKVDKLTFFNEFKVDEEMIESLRTTFQMYEKHLIEEQKAK